MAELLDGLVLDCWVDYLTDDSSTAGWINDWIALKWVDG